MKTSKSISPFFIGLALFSMFFGAGNLIFPLFVGKLSKDLCLFSILGFLLTGVLLPFLGIITMVIYRGNYAKFFTTLGDKGGFLLATFLLSVWIPFGSAPRCITLAFASFSSYFTVLPYWMFSLLYCILLYFVLYKKTRMLDILGYVLTPILLVCLAIVIIKGTCTSIAFSPSLHSPSELFLQGIKEGYNTMDLIAAFFFSASIIGIIKASSGSEKIALSKAIKASLVGVITLGIVYVGLIAVAAKHSAMLDTIPKDQLMVHMAKVLLGPNLGGIATLAIILACFTTSVALVVVYAEFIQTKIQTKKDNPYISLVLTLSITFIMSLLGLEGITFLTEPLLQIFYPTLLALMLWNIGRHYLKKPKPALENIDA